MLIKPTAVSPSWAVAFLENGTHDLAVLSGIGAEGDRAVVESPARNSPVTPKP